VIGLDAVKLSLEQSPLAITKEPTRAKSLINVIGLDAVKLSFSQPILKIIKEPTRAKSLREAAF
jgi:hypothetical protein